MTRQLIFADLNVMARALRAVTPERRVPLARHILRCAGYADTYRRKLKKPHPRWGDGSVDAAARAFKLAAPSSFHDLDYSACFCCALETWLRERQDKTP